MKYLLDTNIVSQYAKARSDLRVDAWLARTDDRDLYLSTLTVAELWQGIERDRVGSILLVAGMQTACDEVDE